MKLTGAKKILSISKLWKKSSEEVRPEDQQPRSATADRRSPKSRYCIVAVCAEQYEKLRKSVSINSR
ncbi:hypothetical protein Glove_164g65 [Diversispora epigaea]|uniref:Uncharacterized protein n=1 Tax=Diversispora epigaea TaxID=1348612 RepID=A0A397IUS8_9GLOM|nr:hypothetical protein Glove_164g65 [Diversispora epigaea]